MKDLFKSPDFSRLFPLLLAAAAFSAFWPSLRNDFVGWDDGTLLLQNPHFREWGLSSLRWMSTTLFMGHYMPLTWLSYGLDYFLWGYNPVGYHLTSLILHAANAVLAYYACLRAVHIGVPAAEPQDARTGCFLAALFFAVHPLRVESVAWATERRDVLSAFFLLFSFIFYLKRFSSRRPAGDFLVCFALFLASLFSKAIGMVFPAVLLIADVYPLGRCRAGGRFQKGLLWKCVREKLPFFALSALFAYLAGKAQVETGAAFSMGIWPWHRRLAQAAFGAGFYVYKTLLPFCLSPIYDAGTFRGTHAAALFYGTAAAVFAGAFFFRRRWPALAAAACAYVVFLSPTSGIFQSGPQFVADRYSYFSCLSWSFALAPAWRLLRNPQTRRLFHLLVFLACLGLMGLTMEQCLVWRNTDSLWSKAMACAPRSLLLKKKWGIILITRGQYAEALRHYERLLAEDPEAPDILDNLGFIHMRMDRRAEAKIFFEKALRLNPSYAESHNNIGALYMDSGEFDLAMDHFKRALEAKPHYAEVHVNRGIALAKQGRLDQALAEQEEALRLEPRLVEAHANAALILQAQGRLEEAKRHLETARKISPEFDGKLFLTK